MSHKSGTIIIRRVTASTETDPVREITVELDVSGMTPEEAGQLVRKMSRKIDKLESHED